MLYLLSFKGKEMNVSVRSCPFAKSLFGLVEGMLKKMVSQIEGSLASCYGLVNVEVNEDTSKISSWVKSANVDEQSVKMWPTSMNFLNGGP